MKHTGLLACECCCETIHYHWIITLGSHVTDYQFKAQLSSITDSTSARQSFSRKLDRQPSVSGRFYRKVHNLQRALHEPLSSRLVIIELCNREINVLLTGLVTFSAETSKEEHRWRTAGHIFIAKTFGKEHLKIHFSRNRNASVLYVKSMCRITT